MRALVRGDLRVGGEEERELIHAVEEAASGEGIDSERALFSIRKRHGLARKIHGDGAFRRAAQLLHQPRMLGFRDHHRQQSVLERIGPEDIRERLGDDGSEAVIPECPWRVLARRSAPKVAPRNENSRAARFRPVQREVGTRRPSLPRGVESPIGEEMRAEPGANSGREKASRDDLVGIDVVEQKQRGTRGESCERFHDHISVRASVIWPATAAAAAVSGLARNVRPPTPWRPSKFLLLVLTAYWPGCKRSSFIPMHMEQPGSRHSAPAATNMSRSPSCSAALRTACDPGTTSMRTPGATRRPSSSAAAAR